MCEDHDEGHSLKHVGLTKTMYTKTIAGDFFSFLHVHWKCHNFLLCIYFTQKHDICPQGYYQLYSPKYIYIVFFTFVGYIIKFKQCEVIFHRTIFFLWPSHERYHYCDCDFWLWWMIFLNFWECCLFESEQTFICRQSQVIRGDRHVRKTQTESKRSGTSQDVNVKHISALICFSSDGKPSQKLQFIVIERNTCTLSISAGAI